MKAGFKGFVQLSYQFKSRLTNQYIFFYLNLKNPDDLNIIRGPQVQTKKKTHRRALGCNPTPPLIGSNYPW
jgi:hypothetical protein